MYKKYIKRLFDFILSLLGLIVLSPVFLIVSILVRIKLGTPVIFKQKRPGKNEKIFTLYKFRTMTDERDENGNLLPDEKRLTKFGKILRSTSLDELPELINILKGDMSLIGPRPLLVSYLPYYTEQELHRHDVRPGLTGLAQINGRNAVNWEERFRLDIEYVNNISLKNDLKIFLTTFKKVIKRENVLSGNKQVLKNFDVERSKIVKRLNIYDIKNNEIILKEFLKELRINYFDGDIDKEVKRIYNNMEKYIQDNSAIILGLYILNKIEGFIWGYEILNDCIHINYFFISKKLRHQGYGTMLINELQRYTNKDIELLVDKKNEDGYNFYLNKGFEILEENESTFKLIKYREKI